MSLADADGHIEDDGYPDRPVPPNEGGGGPCYENGRCIIEAGAGHKDSSDPESQSGKKQVFKGTVKIGLGVGLVATAMFGDVPGGLVGVTLLTSAIIGGSTTAVPGVTDVVGGATHTNVESAQKGLEATSNLPGLVASAAWKGNLGIGQTVATVSDIATTVAKPREVVQNVATVGDAVRTAKAGIDLSKSTYNRFKDAIFQAAAWLGTNVAN